MNKAISVNLKGNEYKLSFPLAGQFIDIEYNKAFLSKGRYGQMVNSETFDSNFALDMIDMQSHLSVLMPKEFWEDLKVNSLNDLDLEDSLELLKVFKKQIQPFIQEWRDLLVKFYKEELK
jgi:hypothetical protein